VEAPQRKEMVTATVATRNQKGLRTMKRGDGQMGDGNGEEWWA
jgi:hypothetical protein